MTFTFTGGSITDPEYDTAKDSLYGLYRNATTGQRSLVSIKLSTGTYNALGANTIPNLSPPYLTAYDDVNRRYFAAGGGLLLHSISAATGSVLSSQPLNLPAMTEWLVHMHYNTTTNTLIGLKQSTSTGSCTLVSINPVSGAVTSIGLGIPYSIGGGGPYFNGATGSSTIDETNQRYYYIYSTASTTYYLAALDIATGNLISNNLIPLNAGDNISSISFDNVKGKLFGMQWDANISTSTSIRTFNPDDFTLYPNPTEALINLKAKAELGRIDIYNGLGELVLKKESNSREEQMDISKFNPGMYLLKIQGSYYKIIKH